MTDGYTAVAPALQTLARDIDAHGQTASTLVTRLRGVALPAAAFGRLPSSGAAATRSHEEVSRSADHIRDQVESLGRATQGVTTAAGRYQECDALTARGSDELRACLARLAVAR